MPTNELSGASGPAQPRPTRRVRAALLSGVQAVARIGELPAYYSRWDVLLQAATTVVVALLFVAGVAGPALQRYLQAESLANLPFTGLTRPSVESFIAVGLVILMSIVLSRFPWFLYASFQSTKKARIRGDIWTDLLALGYGMKLRLSGAAEQVLTEFETNEIKARYGGQDHTPAGPWPEAGGVPGGAHGNGRLDAPLPDMLAWPADTPDAAGQEPASAPVLASVLATGLATGQPVVAGVTSPDPGRLARSDEVALRAFTKRFEDSYGYAPFRGPLGSITIFYLIGWLMVLLPNGLSANAAQASGMGGLAALISGGMSGYISHVAGGLTVVSAAFLGAYTFSVTSLFRRYIRSDFKPTAVTQACLRLVTAWIAGFLLSFAADLSFPLVSRAWLLVVAFFMGVFALNAVSILWELTVKKLPELAHFGQGLKPSELTELDGLDAWHEDRLGEAGIDSVRALANVDFLDLLIGVRMPTETLVDWVDQALLRIHVSAPTWRFLLNRTSIRTASDMLDFLGRPGGKEQLAGLAAQTKDAQDGLAGADADMLQDTLGREPNAARIVSYHVIQKRIAEGSETFPPAWWSV